MAATERSTSSAVVAQELKLMRMAARPRQVVPPHQQVPASWISAMTRRVLPDDGNARVIGHVEPLVRIHRPGIGGAEASRERCLLRR